MRLSQLDKEQIKSQCSDALSETDFKSFTPEFEFAACGVSTFLWVFLDTDFCAFSFKQLENVMTASKNHGLKVDQILLFPQALSRTQLRVCFKF